MTPRRPPPAAPRRFFDAVIQGADVDSALFCGRLLARRGLTVLVCERDLSLAPGPTAELAGRKESR